MVLNMDISTVISIVWSTVEISFTGKPKPTDKGPTPKPLPVKLVFEVKHYGLKK